MDNSIFVGQKIMLMKEYGNLAKVGTIYEVGNITDNHVVIRNSKNKIAVGAIDINSFKIFFNPFGGKMKYTAWAAITSALSGDVVAEYRTNGHKTIVRCFIEENLIERSIVKRRNTYECTCVKASSSCNKNDDFSLAIGINLAYERCLQKIVAKRINDLNILLEKNKYDLKGIENRIRNIKIRASYSPSK